MPKAAYYAVAAGRKRGVYTTWSEAEAQVKGYTGAKHKKFPTEAQAKAYLAGGGDTAAALATGPRSIPARRNGGQTPTSTLSGFETHFQSSSPSTSAPISSLPPDLQAIANRGFAFSTSKYLVVYTDGSALGNGQKGSKAGAGVFWGDGGEAVMLNLAERVPGDPQTNNRGELFAVVRALEKCPYPALPLEIRCDSQYTINCMTKWLPKWLANNFKKGGVGNEDVMNQELIKHLLVLLRRRGRAAKVKFKYVPAHVGVAGNEAADRLAKQGAMMAEVNAKRGWLDGDEPEKSAAQGRVGEKLAVVEVEVDEDCLMTDAELEEFERSLV